MQMEVRFEGRVQGVGFRFTTVELASRFSVSGYVRNDFDGSVQLVAEGEEAELLGFLEAIRRSPVGRYISRQESFWRPAGGTYTGFDVRY